MNRDIAEKWIADLRTNPPQARGVLFDGTGYCCLGRLCVLAGMEPERVHDTGHYGFLGITFSLPGAVIDWAGMQTANAKYGVVDEEPATLAQDNDSGKTFAEIADIIAAHIDEL